MKTKQPQFGRYRWNERHLARIIGGKHQIEDLHKVLLAIGRTLCREHDLRPLQLAEMMELAQHCCADLKPAEDRLLTEFIKFLKLSERDLYDH